MVPRSHGDNAVAVLHDLAAMAVKHNEMTLERAHAINNLIDAFEGNRIPLPPTEPQLFAQLRDAIYGWPNDEPNQLAEHILGMFTIPPKEV